MLLDGFVKKITINDKDRSIYAFWYSFLNYTDQFYNLIQNTELTIKEWRVQQDIQKNKEQEGLSSFGFSTFYLNRTNRSGIINTGVIGGVNQNGNS